MGMLYEVTVNDWQTSASADAFETAVAAKTGAGARVRLRELHVGSAEDTPTDKTIAVRINRTDGTGAGTSTSITAANLARPDPGTPNPVNVTGETIFTAEPTNYDANPLYEDGMNMRGRLDQWWDAEHAPAVGASAILGVLIAPRDATAKRLSITAVFEVY